MLRHYGDILKLVFSPKKLQEGDGVLIQIGREIKAVVDKRFRGSLAILEVDVGSCNGSELEIHDLNNVYYNIERFGIHFFASPRHADILFVTGLVSRHMEAALKRTYLALLQGLPTLYCHP